MDGGELEDKAVLEGGRKGRLQGKREESGKGGGDAGEVEVEIYRGRWEGCVGGGGGG